MHEARITELRSIDVMSVFRFSGGIFLIIGLIAGLFGNILRIDVMSPDIIRIFPFMSRMGPGIFAGILFGLLYGLSAGIVSSIFALLYNFFASLLGGLKFGLRD